MYPGSNLVTLDANCFTWQTIIHEVGHRLGFDHEHQRPDRDRFIRVDCGVPPHPRD
jgi:hypothetical protein